MANEVPGIPNPTLPIWADNLGVLSQNFLSKKVRPPFKGGQPWLGQMPAPATGAGFDSLPTASGGGYNYSARVTNPQTPTNATLSSNYTPKGEGINWNNVAEATNKITPFISNIANSFRRVPQPIAPGQLSPITLNKVDNSNELANIDAQTRSMDLAADRGLDGNGAASVRSGNLATKLRAYGDSYSRTANQNTEIGNQQNMFNANIEDRNMRARDQYNDELTSAKIAQQRASSENISNAADKFVALQNSRAQRDLDVKKWTDASRMFNKGVMDRYENYLANPAYESQKLQDERDKENEDYRKKPKAQMGGMLKRLKKAY